MINSIDNFLSSKTMYRLVLYYLIALLGVATVLSFLKILPFSPLPLILHTLFLLVVSYLTGEIFVRVFGALPNVESTVITALILALIITPVKSIGDLWFLFFAAVLAISSKYILALFNKHFFNPAALAVAATAIFAQASASWWVGTAAMLPFVFVGGVLIVRKIRRGDLVYYFVLMAAVVTLIFAIVHHSDVGVISKHLILDSPLFFLAFVMLTEPLTMPPTKNLQIIYGAIVGFIFVPQVHLGSLYFTPELALLCGNVFSYFVSPKRKLLLTLREKIKVAENTYDFVFDGKNGLWFSPGQYLEWTLAPSDSDNRGNRRYFTIASSPTQRALRLGVKFYPNSSTYKRKLLAMKQGEKILAGALAGDFTLPRDKNKKLAFVAGGIGITPFCSMIKFLSSSNERRDIVMFYANNHIGDIAYADVFNVAATKIGLRTVYVLSDVAAAPTTWRGHLGLIDAKMIVREIPDFKDRLFYLSGPHAMVVAFEKTLRQMGLKSSQIKTDYFPGFA